MSPAINITDSLLKKREGNIIVACNPTQHIFLLGQPVQACTAGQAERASRETPAVFSQAAGAFFSLREHIELGRMHATIISLAIVCL